MSWTVEPLEGEVGCFAKANFKHRVEGLAWFLPIFPYMLRDSDLKAYGKNA